MATVSELLVPLAAEVDWRNQGICAVLEAATLVIIAVIVIDYYKWCTEITIAVIARGDFAW